VVLLWHCIQAAARPRHGVPPSCAAVCAASIFPIFFPQLISACVRPHLPPPHFFSTPLQAFTQENLDFQEKVLLRSGLGEETYLPECECWTRDGTVWKGWLVWMGMREHRPALLWHGGAVLHKACCSLGAMILWQSGCVWPGCVVPLS